jgi:hypothetical protein
MKAVAEEFEKLIENYVVQLDALPEAEFDIRSAPGKWSKKEMLGHLVDSAESNIRRFVVAQYEQDPLIVYNQDKWVMINDYASWKMNDLIQLWYLLNKQVCYVLKNTSEETAQRTCKTQDLHTIEWLAIDYIKHLKHHLHEVLSLEAVAYS